MKNAEDGPTDDLFARAGGRLGVILLERGDHDTERLSELSVVVAASGSRRSDNRSGFTSRSDGGIGVEMRKMEATTVRLGFMPEETSWGIGFEPDLL